MQQKGAIGKGVVAADVGRQVKHVTARVGVSATIVPHRDAPVFILKRHNPRHSHHNHSHSSKGTIYRYDTRPD